MQITSTVNSVEVEYAALIGLDWSDKEHALCLYAAGTGRFEEASVENTVEALEEWLSALQARFAGEKVAICLEQTRGMLIYKLMSYGFISLYPINPALAAKYRQAFTPSGAKDDPSDAALLLDLLLHHRDRLARWHPDDEQTRELARLCEERRQAVNLRTKLVQQLGAKLKSYYPQALTLAGDDLSSPLAGDFLQRWPCLESAQRAQAPTLRKFYYGHNCRSEKRLAARLELLRNARPVTTDQAVIAPLRTTIKMLARLLRDLHAAIREFEQQIKTIFAAHPDAALFASLPGAGKALAPRLLAAFGRDRRRFNSAEEMQNCSGIAPVTERSGKRQWVHCRWRCPKFLRQSFHEFARSSLAWSSWAQAYCELHKSPGKKFHTIVRALAFKWIRILFACWKNHTPYDEQKYLEALKRRGSPLCQYLNSTPNQPEKNHQTT